MSVKWVRLALDLEGNSKLLARSDPPAGITLTTLQELGDSESHRHLVYELNKTCSADIPDRGVFFTFEEYERLRFEAPGTRSDGLVLAFDHDVTLGMCQLTCPPDQWWAFIEMTGVLRPYRGRGVATAMKLRALQAARSWGCTEVRTFHHPNNRAIIAANRSLGFREANFEV